MGTRSLLAVQTNSKEYHVQYMQFDGYPSVKGYEYYSAILQTLLDGGLTHFTFKNGKPNTKFRKRCLDFLNNYQYTTHHSMGNNYKTAIKEWKDIDSWQEWQYLFDSNGDFTFFNIHSGDTHTECIIPWEFTKGLAEAFSITCLGIGELGEKEDNVIKAIFSNLDAVVTLETGEAYAFENQNDEGWRKYGILTVTLDGKEIAKEESMFSSRVKYSHRNEKVITLNQTVGKYDKTEVE